MPKHTPKERAKKSRPKMGSRSLSGKLAKKKSVKVASKDKKKKKK